MEDHRSGAGRGSRLGAGRVADTGYAYGADAWIWVQNFAGNITGAWRRVTSHMVTKFFQMEDMVPTKRPVVVVR